MRGLIRTWGLGFCAAWGLAACSSDEGTPSDAADTGDTSDTGADTLDTGGTGNTGDTGDSETSWPSGPLLEWPGARTLACAAEHEAAMAEPSDWALLDLEAGPATHGYVLASQSGFGLGNARFIAGLTTSGALVDQLELDSDAGYGAGGSIATLGPAPASAAAARTFIVAWARILESGAGVLRVAIADVDAAGKLTLTHAGQDVPGLTGLAIQGVQLVPAASAGDGATAFFATRASDGSSWDTTLRMVALGADGAAKGSVKTLVAGAYDANVVATDEGFAAVWTQAATAGTEVFFGRFAADGAAIGTPRRLSAAGSQSASGTLTPFGGGALLRVHGALWATWSESTFNGDWDHPDGRSVVKLAVLDASGNGPIATLQDSAPSTANVNPSLVLSADRVGLSWSTGTVIYICAGCYVDYVVKFVLLDAATAYPISNVGELATVNGHGHAYGGFVALGGEFLMASTLDFHALTKPASGAILCLPPGP